jgi:hypothetical protein
MQVHRGDAENAEKREEKREMSNMKSKVQLEFRVQHFSSAITRDLVVNDRV